jgi:hypothetical protein
MRLCFCECGFFLSLSSSMEKNLLNCSFLFFLHYDWRGDFRNYLNHYSSDMCSKLEYSDSFEKSLAQSNKTYYTCECMSWLHSLRMS